MIFFVNVYICMYIYIHVYVNVSIVFMLCSPMLEEIKNLSIYKYNDYDVR